jgi:hypothetical protein
MSLCNQVLDLTDDTSKKLLKEILEGSEVPAMVKTAQVATRAAQEKFNRADYALIAITKEGSELRKYPINDAANTWLSCRYFEKTAHKLPTRAREVTATMLKRVFRPGNLYYEAYDMSKTAQPVAVETVQRDGSKHFYALGDKYAMPNPEFIKRAGQYFVEHEKSFTDPLERHTFAHNVLERAKELQVELMQKEALEKYAGASYGDLLETQIRMRHDLVQAKPELGEALTKVASYKKELQPQEFAKLLHGFDKKASLDKYYGGYLADPYKSTFETRFTKVASGYSYDSDEGHVSEKELTKAFEDKYDKVKGYFGPTVADQLKKHGCEIFASLPKDAKEVITKIAKGQI